MSFDCPKIQVVGASNKESFWRDINYRPPFVIVQVPREKKKTHTYVFTRFVVIKPDSNGVKVYVCKKHLFPPTVDEDAIMQWIVQYTVSKKRPVFIDNVVKRTFKGGDGVTYDEYIMYLSYPRK